MQTWFYKNKNGDRCKLFSLWVAENGSEQDILVHDNPESTDEKSELLRRYFKAEKVYSFEILEDGVVVEEVSLIDKFFNDMGPLKAKKILVELGYFGIE
jgi:hypothetical protein